MGSSVGLFLFSIAVLFKKLLLAQVNQHAQRCPNINVNWEMR